MKELKVMFHEEQLGTLGLEKSRLKHLIAFYLPEEGKWREEVLIFSPWCPVKRRLRMVHRCLRGYSVLTEQAL